MPTLRSRLKLIFSRGIAGQDARAHLRARYREALFFLLILGLIVIVSLRALLKEEFNPKHLDLNALLNGTLGHTAELATSAEEMVRREPAYALSSDKLLRMSCDERRDADADCDGILDGAEVYFGTNTSIADTDGDGVIDGIEAVEGFDPLSRYDVPPPQHARWGVKMAELMKSVDLAELTRGIFASRITDVEARADLALRELGATLANDPVSLLPVLFGRTPSPPEIEFARHLPLPHDPRSNLLRILSSPPAASMQLNRLFRRTYGSAVTDEELSVLVGKSTLQNPSYFAADVANLLSSNRLYVEKCGSDEVRFIRYAYLKITGRPPFPDEITDMHALVDSVLKKGPDWRPPFVQALTQQPAGKRGLLSDFIIAIREARHAS